MFSLTVSRTDEIDSIVPFSVHRAPGNTWYISRVELAPADDAPKVVWQKYHASGVSVRGEFPKFGSSSKIAENIGALGKWGGKLCNIKRVNEEKTNVWSVLHKSVVRSPASGSDVFNAWATTDSTNTSMRPNRLPCDNNRVR
jgi:hypothetical protein